MKNHYHSIKVLYANTNISLDVMMGYENGVERLMVSEGIWIDYDYIENNYSQVLALYLDQEFLAPADVCESIFRKLNRITTERLTQQVNFDAQFLPENKEYTESGYIGHTSMSVGDIVIIETKEAKRIYFCDNYGFKDITLDVKVSSEIKKDIRNHMANIGMKPNGRFVKKNKEAV